MSNFLKKSIQKWCVSGPINVIMESIQNTAHIKVGSMGVLLILSYKVYKMEHKFTYPCLWVSQLSTYI